MFDCLKQRSYLIITLWVFFRTNGWNQPFFLMIEENFKEPESIGWIKPKQAWHLSNISCRSWFFTVLVCVLKLLYVWRNQGGQSSKTVIWDIIDIHMEPRGYHDTDWRIGSLSWPNVLGLLIPLVLARTKHVFFPVQRGRGWHLTLTAADRLMLCIMMLNECIENEFNYQQTAEHLSTLVFWDC